MVTHLVKDILKKVYVKRDGRKYQHGECLYALNKLKLFLSVSVDDRKWLERSSTWIPCGKLWKKDIDFED